MVCNTWLSLYPVGLCLYYVTESFECARHKNTASSLDTAEALEIINLKTEENFLKSRVILNNAISSHDLI